MPPFSSCSGLVPRWAGILAAVLTASGPLLGAGPPQAAAEGTTALLGEWTPRLWLEARSATELVGGGMLGLELTVAVSAAPPTDRVPLRLVAPSVRVVGDVGVRPPLGGVDGPGPEGPSDAGDDVGVGAEFLLSFPAKESSAESASRWAYARVLDVEDKGVFLEVLTAAESLPRLVRDPLSVDALRDGSSVKLTWTPGEAAGSDGSRTELSVAMPRAYRVLRRPCHRAGEGSFTTLGVVRGASYTDDGAGALNEVFEYAVVRVDDAGEVAAGVMGSVDILGPDDDLSSFAGDRTLIVGTGSSVDLLWNKAVPSGDAHVTMSRAAPGSIALVPSEGTRFSGLGDGKQGKTSPSWWLAPPDHPTFVPGRTVLLRDGVEAVFCLPNGVVGRLVAHELDGDRWALERHLALDGSRLLPRAPEAAPWLDPGPNGSPRLRSKPLHKAAGVASEAVQLVVEREAPFGSSRWTVHGTTEIASTSLEAKTLFERDEPTLGADLAPVVRVRLRYLTATGTLSPPGEAVLLLASAALPARAESDLGRALDDLDSTDFQRRLEARAVLRALGESARAGLEAVATGDSGRRADAARELLAAIALGGEDGRRRTEDLVQRAVESVDLRTVATDRDFDITAWLGAPPAGLIDADPSVRAHALLALIDGAERVSAAPGDRAGAPGGEALARAQAWLRAVAAGDRDEGVRALAGFELEIGPSSPDWALAPAGAAWLQPARLARSDPELELHWSELPSDRLDLLWAIEARRELCDLDLGGPLARLRAVLHRPDLHAGFDLSVESGDARFFDYDARAAELVLRLVERARAAGNDARAKRVFLGAAEELLPGEALTLDAWRQISDRRRGPQAAPPPQPGERRRVEVDRADLDQLETTLLALNDTYDPAVDAAGVDLVLSAGTYGDPAATGRLLEVRRPDVRLMAEGQGEVVIHAGVRAAGAERLVLERITLNCSFGQAITAVDDAHVVAVASTLAGAGTVVHAQASTVELFDCRVLGSDPAQPPSTAIRLILGARLLARTTLVDAGTLFVSSDAEAWLDRCVLDAGIRTLVQSQDGGRLCVRESLLRGEAMGLFRVTVGVLAGTVIDVPREPLGRTSTAADPGRLRVSPRWFRLVQPGGSVPVSMKLEREPLGRR